MSVYAPSRGPSVWLRHDDVYPWVLLAVVGLLAGVLYGCAAHLPLMTPVVIPEGAIDRRIPFVPEAAWAYATYALLLPVLVLTARRLRHFERVFTAGAAAALVNAVIYVVWPTQLESRTEAPHGTLLWLIQQVDTTLCALPSGHVSLPTAITAATALTSLEGPRTDARRWRALTAIFLPWTFVLAVSTLLTKQHFAIDVVAGASLGLATALVCVRLKSARLLFPWIERGERVALPAPRIDVFFGSRGSPPT